MTSTLILGSGPAAAGVALALTEHGDVDVHVLDIGLQLEAENERAAELLAESSPPHWSAELVAAVARRPVAGGEGLPEKRSYGSDYSFRDIGQLSGIASSGDVTNRLVSAAYGGFSSVWGAQLMPFTARTFDRWPFDATEMRPHYESILRQIPFSGAQDDLSTLFPLMGEPDALPPLSQRTRLTLSAYQRHRATLNRRGILMGAARLALRSSGCVRCGLCMTGCPYGLIYSASQTFDELVRSGSVRRTSGLLAVRVAESDGCAEVYAKDLATGSIHRFEADRVYVACGSMGTTRLVAQSLGLFETEFTMRESQQYVLPLLSLRPTQDPRGERDFTLNQFNIVVGDDPDGVDLSQLHVYTFDPAFLDALPVPLRAQQAEPARAAVLRRLAVAFGYLPSWRSPSLIARFSPAGDGADLPGVRISRGASPPGRNEMLRAVLGRLARSAPLLDLYPVLPMLRLAAGGRSYHWGGSFPHGRVTGLTSHSDRLGRVGPWSRIHLVDGSVLPDVPAMTFTLTVMANAHRIAHRSLAEAAA